MTETEKKTKFIQLRAEGQSYSKIAAAIDISKSTCTRWNKELKAELEKRESETLQQLYNQYGATRYARIKATGETLNKIEKAIASKDFDSVPLEKLLQLKLKYIEALKAEYQPITNRKEIQEITPQSIVEALRELLQAIRAGEISEKQAEHETKVITALLKAMQDVEAAEKENPNITIVVSPASEEDFKEEIKKDRKGITIIEDLEPDE